jgi:putative ABC transport system permease protein
LSGICAFRKSTQRPKIFRSAAHAARAHAIHQLTHDRQADADIQSVDDLRVGVYRQEQQMTSMVAAVALLSVGVAMLGAYTLVADTLRRRRMDLVLHRLHGAGDFAVVRRVAVEFAIPLLVSAAVSLPLAAWLGKSYLAGFVDRVGSGTGIALPILAASAAILGITATAALRHIRQALAIQPVEALK